MNLFITSLANSATPCSMTSIIPFFESFPSFLKFGRSAGILAEREINIFYPVRLKGKHNNVIDPGWKLNCIWGSLKQSLSLVIQFDLINALSRNQI